MIFMQPFSYCKRIALDYITIIKNTLIESRKKPVRTCSILFALYGINYAKTTKPNRQELFDKLSELRQNMALVPDAIQSTRANRTLNELTELQNKHRLEVLDCFLFSVVIKRPYDRKCNLYIASDNHLRSWPWIEFWENAMDIGALNRFWCLEASFVDYDIRTEEFDDR